MSIAIMQAYFFPYIGYFQLINSADTFLIYEHVTFRKKSWITRNRILDKGKIAPIFIRVPIIKQSSNKLISEVKIDNKTEWRKTIKDLLFYNYKKAPFFDEIYNELIGMIDIEVEDLHTYNSQITQRICTLLDIGTKIIHNNSDCLELENNLLRNNKNEIKTQRIVELCKQQKVKHYINPIGGIDLYSKKEFNENDLKLSFINTLPFTYNQFGLDHQPYLSIIDVLMHEGIRGTKQLIKKYKLI
jgi:hypothetical protein